MQPFLEEIGNETFIRFRIWEIVSGNDFEPYRAFGMASEIFREAVRCSLHLWPAIRLPRVYRPMLEIMEEVEFGSSGTMVGIPICGHTKITSEDRHTDVLIPLATFVRGALEYLADIPKIAIWERPASLGDSGRSFLQKWNIVLDELREKEKAA